MLRSERLVLRPYTDEDIPHLVTLYTDWKWEGVNTVFATTFLHEVIQKQYEFGGGVLATFLKGDTTEFQQYIGHCGLKYIAEKHEWYLSFRFIKAYWRENYPSEAIETCLKWGFNSLNINEIVLDLTENNRAVIKTITKAGFKFRCNFEENGVIIERYSIFS
jgi:[ribosomal protein S5]-alanine N-acetyltransferase